MALRTLAKIASFLLGIGLALQGAAWAYVVASGALKSGSSGSYGAACWLLFAATPCLAFPFSSRAAKALLVAFIVAVATVLLWLAFRLNLPGGQPASVQVAAIALVVLLIARIGLALRRKPSAPGT